jgi:hypothetical protein
MDAIALAGNSCSFDLQLRYCRVPQVFVSAPDDTQYPDWVRCCSQNPV